MMMAMVFYLVVIHSENILLLILYLPCIFLNERKNVDPFTNFQNKNLPQIPQGEL